MKLVYQFGGPFGGKEGTRDMTYNSRRNILGALPLHQKIAYHLFSIDAYASKTEDMVKLYTKSKWHTLHETFDEDSCNLELIRLLKILNFNAQLLVLLRVSTLTLWEREQPSLITSECA